MMWIIVVCLNGWKADEQDKIQKGKQNKKAEKDE